MGVAFISTLNFSPHPDLAAVPDSRQTRGSRSAAGAATRASIVFFIAPAPFKKKPKP
jgi:hypothetical protein